MSIATCASTSLAVDSRNQKEEREKSVVLAKCGLPLDDDPANKLGFAISAGKLGIGQSSILPRLFPLSPSFFFF